MTDNPTFLKSYMVEKYEINATLIDAERLSHSRLMKLPHVHLQIYSTDSTDNCGLCLLQPLTIFFS